MKSTILSQYPTIFPLGVLDWSAFRASEASISKYRSIILTRERGSVCYFVIVSLVKFKGFGCGKLEWVMGTEPSISHLTKVKDQRNSHL